MGIPEEHQLDIVRRIRTAVWATNTKQPRFAWASTTRQLLLRYCAILGTFVIGATILALYDHTARPHFLSLLYRSLLAFVASQGGNIWGFFSSNIVAPLLFAVFFVVLLRESHGEEAMRIHWKRDGIIGLKALLLVLLLYYFPIFLWKGVVRTVYEDHTALVAGTARLTKENERLSRENERLSKENATLTQNQPAPFVESADSLRRKTLKLVYDLNLFWSRRQQPHPLSKIQQPTTDEERQSNAMFDKYWGETEAAYRNAGFRERIRGVVSEYKSKGIQTGFLEFADQYNRLVGSAVFEGMVEDCSRNVTDLCTLRELAYHVDAQDRPIVLTFEPHK